VFSGITPDGSFEINLSEDPTGMGHEVGHLFDALLGRPPSPTCAVCGGITVDEGPSNGRCNCPKADSPNTKADFCERSAAE
jgi:hypothetical protein